MQRAIIASASTVVGLAALIAAKANLTPPITTAVAQPAAVAAAPAGAKVVTGKAVQNQYESFRLKVTMAGSKVTKVEVIDFKGDAAMTKQITSAAFPKLEAAAITAGSAKIDTVSGATYTSASYKQSLQSALDQAGTAAAATGAKPPSKTTARKAAAGGGSKAAAGGGSKAAAGGAHKAGAATAKTVVGKSVQNQYESFQVKVTVAGGKITKVEIVGLQASEPRSKSITSDALPRLERAALAANSAKVDTISGATYTSGSYRTSLQSALDQAGL